MKKLLSVLLLAVITLTGCAKFSDGTSVWQDGLWAVPLLTGLGSLWFFVIAWLKSRSGSAQQRPGGGYDYSKENVPVYAIGQFWFACALLIATAIIIIMVIGDR